MSLFRLPTSNTPKCELVLCEDFLSMHRIIEVLIHKALKVRRFKQTRGFKLF